MMRRSSNGLVATILVCIGAVYATACNSPDPSATGSDTTTTDNGSGGGVSPDPSQGGAGNPPAQAPSALNYSTANAIYYQGITIPANTPSSGGGSVASYSVSPALPAGLSLDPVSGNVGGTPSGLSSAATYTITASNSVGSTQATITIEVRNPAPTNLSYTAATGSFTVGTPISANTASYTAGVPGSAVTFSVNPALPPGLTLNSTTGTVSGTPAGAAAFANYTLKASNAYGFASFTFAFSVQTPASAPTNLTYSTNPANYVSGNTITTNSPSSGGGTPTSYSISPALPTGLNFNTTTGQITGTPSVTASGTTYTVTATNPYGSTTLGLVLSVAATPPASPTSVSYSSNPATYVKGTSITTNTPTVGGGTPTTYTVSPALPAGLTLNPSTGLITGTPTSTATVASYTVTASNAGGSRSVNVTITVNDAAPFGLSYTAMSPTFARTVAITPDTASVAATGGTPTSYSVSPALPPGLSLNTTTGTISGTPLAVTAASGYTVTASNVTGNATATLTITVLDAPPANLAYSTNPATYAVGVPIASNNTSSGGGPISSYSVSPALPAGLSLNTTTGQITGTPTAPTGLAHYTVTATSVSGSTTVDLVLTINDSAPLTLSYSTNPASYNTGQSITSNTPSTTGGTPTSYSVSPALPSGLSLDTSTGIITGTPLAVQAASGYTVTASNGVGSKSVILTITVNNNGPTNLTYSTNPATYTAGVAIASNSPSNSGTAITSYSVSPSLPAGLSLDTSTGIVSGTPLAIQAATGYLITGSNAGGSANVTLTIKVNDQAPTGLAYSTNPAVYTKGSAITSNTPSSSGGSVVSYAISPSLPAGLSFDTTTGVISGTPTALAPSGAYTITATNSGGNAQKTISITVNDVAPSLSFNPTSYSFTRFTPITSFAPGNGGGAVLTYAVSPSLPAGLSFDTSSGTISGTPTAVVAYTGFTVTGTNSGGNSSATINFQVNDIAPFNVGYQTPTGVYTINQPITANVPVWSPTGGNPTHFAIANGPLPTGLSMDSTTGVISGTPTVLAAANLFGIYFQNAQGQPMGLVSIAVVDVPPSSLSYSNTPQTVTRYGTLTPMSPTVSGGTVTLYSINPALPSGLSIDPGTGVISGSPALPAPSGTYTITAANSGGQTTANIQLTVSDVAPASLAYQLQGGGAVPGTIGFANGATLVPYQSITGDGIITSYSISPALPDGLALNTTTGVITGKPTAIVASKTYTVTGSNATGSITASFTFATVNDNIPVLTYQDPVIIYGANQNVWNPVTVTAVSGASAFHSTPALPAGLSINAQGNIFGRPTVAAAMRSYVISATSNNSSAVGSAMLQIGVAANAPMVSIVAGAAHACASTAAGVHCWGSNASGELGNGTTVDAGLPVDVSNSGTVAGPTGFFSQIAAGDHHTCGLKGDDVYCWGDNTYGQLGNGSNTSSSTPVKVNQRQTVSSVPITGGVQMLWARGNNTCVLQQGNIYCWGDNSHKQVPTVTYACSGSPPTSYNTPQEVVPVTYGCSATVTQAQPKFAMGTTHFCFVGAGGVQCWGSNGHGELGNGGTTDSFATVSPNAAAITSNSSVSMVTAGNAFTCALQNGNAFCWGDNSSGQVSGASAVTGASTIAAGAHHACAVVNGAAKCWGDNTHGQLGDGTTSNSSTPVAVQGLTSGVTALYAGDYYTCALVNGGLQCWGDNANGQLGQGGTTDNGYPTPVAGMSMTPAQISANANYDANNKVGGVAINTVCYVMGGAAFCKGPYYATGTGTGSATFVTPNGLTSGVSKISVGATGVCAIVDGALKCWGQGYNVNTNLPTTISGLSSGVTDVVVSGTHFCAVQNGSVYCHGGNTLAQLGQGNETANSGNSNPLTGGVTSISANWNGSNTCAVQNNSLRCWGYADSNATYGYTEGSIGTGAVLNGYLVVASPNTLVSSGIQSVSMGVNHLCYQNNNGTLTCRGDNSCGQLGLGTIAGTCGSVYSAGAGAVTGSSRLYQSVTAGLFHSCAVGTDGNAYCWGQNTNEQFGNNSVTSCTGANCIPQLVSSSGSFTGQIISTDSQNYAMMNGTPTIWGNNSTPIYYTVPNAVTGVIPTYATTKVPTTFASGQRATCAMFGGTLEVYCWGSNAHGEWGNGSTAAAVNAPMAIAGASYGSGYRQMTLGASHGCYLINGGVKCAGDNSYGQLGIGGATGSGQATLVAPSGMGSGVTRVASGDNHSCAIVSGSLYCWGKGDSGQLGDGNGTTSTAPVKVTAPSGKGPFVDVTAGSNHTCAVLWPDMSVYCWGDNTNGQIGQTNNGSTTLAPTALVGTGAVAVTNAVLVDASGPNTCISTGGATAQCFGPGGALWGTGTTVTFAANIQHLSVGNNAVCAVLANGTSACAGSGIQGQLGSGTSDRTTPYPVSGLNGIGLFGAALGNTQSFIATEKGMFSFGTGNNGDLATGVSSATNTSAAATVAAPW